MPQANGQKLEKDSETLISYSVLELREAQYTLLYLDISGRQRDHAWRSQVAERLGNQKVAGSIPGCEKMTLVLDQGTSPCLPRGNVPVLTLSPSG